MDENITDLLTASITLFGIMFGGWAVYVRKAALAAKQGGEEVRAIRVSLEKIVEMRLDGFAKELERQTNTLKAMCKDLRMLEVDHAKRLAVIEDRHLRGRSDNGSSKYES